MSFSVSFSIGFVDGGFLRAGSSEFRIVLTDFNTKSTEDGSNILGTSADVLVTDIEVLFGCGFLTDTDKCPVDGSNDVPSVVTNVGERTSDSSKCSVDILSKVASRLGGKAEKAGA